MVKAEELLANPWEPDISPRWHSTLVFWAPMLPGASEEKHVAVAWPS